jgi:NAD(P)-dependent dehydrogenase (short-subunit alcohol dehydrogenase family)
MLREGASVLMTDMSTTGLTAALQKVNIAIPPSLRAGKVETKTVDVSDESQFEAAVSHLDFWDGIDVIFNNAESCIHTMETRSSIRRISGIARWTLMSRVFGLDLNILCLDSGDMGRRLVV